jgi:hypothetical protein
MACSCSTRQLQLSPGNRALLVLLVGKVTAFNGLLKPLLLLPPLKAPPLACLLLLLSLLLLLLLCNRCLSPAT